MKTKLGELLIENNIISKEELDRVLPQQKDSRKRLGELLIEAKMVSKSELVQILALQLEIPYLRLDTAPVDHEAVALVPEKFVRQTLCFPVALDDGLLTVAMSDPLNLIVLDDLKRYTGREIKPAIAEDSDILAAIEKYYHMDESVDEITDSIPFEDTLEIIQRREELKEEDDIIDLKTQSQMAPVVRMSSLIINEAIFKRASDIHIEPQAELVQVRYRIDGALHEMHQLPKWIQGPLVSRIKVMASLDIAEKRLPQDGQITVKIGARQVDLRISTLPTKYGEKAVMRILDKTASLVGLEELGFSEADIEKIYSLIRRPDGLVLVTGPTGSGKTTTLYSMLEVLRSPSVNIITVENPVEYDIPDTNQVEVNLKTGLTFPYILRSVLRQDPNIVMIGEIRDAETAVIAVQASMTGHLVLSTLHTNNAPAAVPRLLDLGISRHLLSSSLIAILAQRLVRKICTKCKKPYEATDADLRHLRRSLPNLQAVSSFKGTGCSSCDETGYYGRTAVYELLVISPEIKKIVVAGQPEDVIREKAIEEGLTLLTDNVVDKVKNGITTIEEISATFFAERGKTINCPKCRSLIEQSFFACPYCGKILVDVCAHCGRKMESDWRICPFCCSKRENLNLKGLKKERRRVTD